MSENRYPIIYVRGYAMSANERDETAADPFCGFNVGSTVYRATVKKDAPAQKFVFESPVVRLLSEHGYQNVYQNGLDILDEDWKPAPDGETGADVEGIPPTSVIIYRYYDPGSRLLGDGETSEIETYAIGLGKLILRVRDLVGQRHGPGFVPDDFRCYLVAHSMGGLVVRALLQNKALGSPEARAAVAKVFTYATPHNGIEFGGVNVPSWLTASEIDTFSRPVMQKYLATAPVDGRMNFLPADIQPTRENWFCMIGSNRGDYEAAHGVARMFSGHGSDGLVLIENASLWSRDDAELDRPVGSAYTFRSHSGYFGIVNSEEAYQNLVRFLFGDIRVDLWFDVEKVQLPHELEEKQSKVDAVYQVELLASPRGKRWYLSRRIAEEDSPACRTHKELKTDGASPAKEIYLSTVFLANRSKVDAKRPGLSYAMTLGVRVPDYQVDNKFWLDGHYEGSSLYRDTLVLDMIPPPPGAATDKWDVRYGWQSESTGRAPIVLPTSFQQIKDGKMVFRIGLSSLTDSTKRPGITGSVRLEVSAWK